MFYTSKEIKDKYKLSYPMQHKLRAKGLPYIKVPNSSKILYKKEEFEKWFNGK